MQFRVSPLEKKKIIENATLAGVTYGDYLRSIGLVGHRVKHHTEVMSNEVYEVEPGSLQIKRVGEIGVEKSKKHATG